MCENNGDERSGSVNSASWHFKGAGMYKYWVSRRISYISLITHENPPCHSEN